MTRQLCQMVSMFLCAPYNYHVAVHKSLSCSRPVMRIKCTQFNKRNVGSVFHRQGFMQN